MKLLLPSNIYIFIPKIYILFLLLIQISNNEKILIYHDIIKRIFLHIHTKFYDIIQIVCFKTILCSEVALLCEETISLREIIDTLKKRIVMIVLITAVFVAASGLVSYYVLTPVYKSSTQVLVSQQATGAASALQAAGFDTDSKYIDTYNVIMKSPYILNQVIDEMGLDRTHNQLNKQISVAQEGESQVVTISVEDTDPAMAVDITNTVAEVFQREIQNLLRIDNIVVLAPAELPDHPTPISPNPSRNMAIGFVVGLMLAIGLTFLLEFLDNTIRKEQDIEQILDLPVLGVIPKMTENDVTNKKERKKKKKKRSEKIGA